jgi:uncharacterized protein YodC (DUF2158 family)
MIFDIDQEVRVKSTGKIGIVKSYITDGYKLNGKKVEVTKYCVQIGASYYSKWFEENNMEHLYEFDNKFEKELVNLLIDVYLKHNKFEELTKLSIEKNLY